MSKQPLYPHVLKGKLKPDDKSRRKWERITERIPIHPTPAMYWCANQDLHPHSEIVQISTTEENPKCPYCDGVMTWGKYW